MTTGVYPRVCGGTRVTSHLKLSPQGLSPRVRGNLSVAAFLWWAIGSIPACAGEPLGEGLSPRVRGNLSVARDCAGDFGSIPACAGEPLGERPLARDYFGSIPACAGEPLRQQSQFRLYRVYPRVCGGT